MEKAVKVEERTVESLIDIRTEITESYPVEISRKMEILLL
jgi:hypothetical protein